MSLLEIFWAPRARLIVPSLVMPESCLRERRALVGTKNISPIVPSPLGGEGQGGGIAVSF
jgi:hypothetical protein